jgi:dihydroceramidase
MMTNGYWEPHSSSVDFCESNYLNTDWIAEPHNAWSSLLGITGFGLLGLWQTSAIAASAVKGPCQEWRVKLYFAILAITGLGSVFLHSTLHWFFQSSDELPMIYLMLAHLYACAEVDAAPSKPNYPWLAPLMLIIAVVNTITYLTFQHIYWFFLLTFISVSTLALIWTLHLTFYTRYGNCDSRRISKTGTAIYVFAGITPWILDMLYCDSVVLPFADNVLTGPFRGLTPHIMWHFAAGYGGYCQAMNLVCCRFEALQIPVTFHYWLGIVPVVQQQQTHHPKVNKTN